MKRNCSIAARVALAAMLVVAAMPAAAFADGEDPALLGSISGLFSNISTLALVLYEGIVSIAGMIALFQIGKELVPALLSTNKEEHPNFKRHISAALLTIAVLVLLTMAPFIVPAAIEYFGGTADVGLGALTGI